MLQDAMRLVELGALALGGFELAAAWVARARHRRWYPQKIAPRFDRAWTPPAAIIVPTKGAGPDLAKNLGTLLRQDYPHYEVFFAVETTADPGIPVIEALLAQAAREGWSGRGRLVVTGLTTACSQQNANMLAGVAAADTGPAVLAFCDNDVAPQPNWLRALVAPLSSQDVAVTSGYRWVRGRTGTAAEHAHAGIALSMYVHFALFAHIAGKGLWGGSFALRRADYEAWNVGPRWGETISDDMSLMGILQDRRRRSLLVGEVLILTDDTFSSAAAARRWYTRQLLNLKAYERITWALVGAGHLAAALAWAVALAAPLAFALGADPAQLRSLGLGAALLLAVADLAAAAWASGTAPIARRGLFLVRLPWVRALQAGAWIATLGRTVLWWAGVGYHFDRRGRVTRIERPAPGAAT
jgi:ceramide glucosyltransferase